MYAHADFDDEETRNGIFEYFVDKIYVYNDRLVITFYYSEDKTEIALDTLTKITEDSEGAECSTLVRSAPLRKKPNFPSNKSTELKDSNFVQIDNFEFAFELDENRILKDYSIKTKNNLIQWYYEDGEKNFTISIKDNKVLELNKELIGICEKIKIEQDLTPEEENKYVLNMRSIKMFEFENTIKKQAISFFLKDQGVQGYLQITNHRRMENIINNIINYNYFEQEKYNDPKNVMLDIFLDPIPKECHDHFVICVEREKVIENFGDCTMYALNGADVCDLNKEIFSLTVTGFYIFLAQEVVQYNNIDLINNEKILNLLNYKVGMH